MAIGLGLMLGFEFPKNFDSPYKAQSITDFWRRWHISLSTWLRDYLYLPLGGNRKGTVRTYANLLIVMLVGGLWHGAKWNFLVWGAIHGFWLCLERALGKRGFYSSTPAVFRIALTFMIVNLAWVFFRANGLASALEYLGSMFAVHPVPPGAVLARVIFYSPFHIMCMAAAFGIAFFGPQTWELARRITPLKALSALGLLAWAIIALCNQMFNPFLYFQF
ncbi:MAG: hypothetical protein K2W96_23715 [Gemmataceae bacterium]|nr:hypothetical protein [Gemmataceae bacterium]